MGRHARSCAIALKDYLVCWTKPSGKYSLVEITHFRGLTRLRSLWVSVLTLARSSSRTAAAPNVKIGNAHPLRYAERCWITPEGLKVYCEQRVGVVYMR